MEVFIGTPSYDKTLTVDYTRSLIGASILLTGLGVQLHHHVVAGSPFLGKARNDIVEAFLKTQAEYLLFVDADVGFDPVVLPRLLKHKPLIVGGLVPKREPGNEGCYHQNAMTGVVEDGLFQTLEIPTAFMRIHRSVFAKLKKPYFRCESSEDAYGEDIYFCRKWADQGGVMWIDPDIDFSHRGTYAWRGNFYDHCVKTGLLRKAAA